MPRLLAWIYPMLASRLTNSLPALPVLFTLATLAALGGCGETPPASKPGARGIFTTVSDCAILGLLPLDKCTVAYDGATAAHEANAPFYATLKECESAQGPLRCDRTDDGRFRPRFLAFLVVVSDPPGFAPLYAIEPGKVGFRTADNTHLMRDDFTITFSGQAIATANLMAATTESAETESAVSNP